MKVATSARFMSDIEPQTREERLAARLRENLRRRKAQARALESGAVQGDDSAEHRQDGLSANLAGESAGLSKTPSDR